MDMQKEREAFEAIDENIRLLRGAKFKDGEYVALSLFDESSKELAAQLNYGWLMWLSAKAQAIPEGFVLVEREKLAMIFETATNALVYHVAPPKHDALSIIQGIARKAMIEAQEQAND